MVYRWHRTPCQSRSLGPSTSSEVLSVGLGFGCIMTRQLQGCQVVQAEHMHDPLPKSRNSGSSVDQGKPQLLTVPVCLKDDGFRTMDFQHLDLSRMRFSILDNTSRGLIDGPKVRVPLLRLQGTHLRKPEMVVIDTNGAPQTAFRLRCPDTWLKSIRVLAKAGIKRCNPPLIVAGMEGNDAPMKPLR